MDACRNIVSWERTKRSLRPVRFPSYPPVARLLMGKAVGGEVGASKSLRSFQSRSAPAPDAAAEWPLRARSGLSSVKTPQTDRRLDISLGLRLVYPADIPGLM